MARTILVVDDSPTERTIVATALQGRGYRVITATDGDEALTKAAAERPDLVVLDIVMPKRNGFQVCRALKTSRATEAIKVVMLTAKQLESDRFWGMKQGADGYLTKPYQEADLLAAVGGLL
jgi:DNA-binding response OmpR family regulator